MSAQYEVEREGGQDLSLLAIMGAGPSVGGSKEAISLNTVLDMEAHQQPNDPNPQNTACLLTLLADAEN